MSRYISRRLERLETRVAAASRREFFSARIRFIDPEYGLTEVLVIQNDKTTLVAPTVEEVESVREYLEYRRAARM